MPGAALIFVATPGGALLKFGDAYVVFAGSGPVFSKPLRRRQRRPQRTQVIGMTTYLSAAELVRRVVDFSQRQPEWAECVIYQTLPDERWDLTLVSQRVYGNRDEVLAVMAAAGLDSVEQELTERRIVLPTARQLADIKSPAGYVGTRWERSPELASDPVNGR